MKVELEFAEGTPTSEFDKSFLQGMLDRMAMSYWKYGKVADGFPTRIDAIASLKMRLDKYKTTGNTEFLMDAANFAMIEFMRPKHPKAHFKASDSHESPGRKRNGEVNPTQESNNAGFEPPPSGWRS